ncbi:uncharacterized protein LOC133920193 [Phragmites australis]|uniref:uncharacterized protein LOC133920193 n=1 Tax=Phragmites australis TaxID=29695 RepID=UPI002D787EC3|nr:uncharacterized protein LOC133920193 [Phragmites australis]
MPSWARAQPFSSAPAVPIASRSRQRPGNQPWIAWSRRSPQLRSPPFPPTSSTVADFTPRAVVAIAAVELAPATSELCVSLHEDPHGTLNILVPSAGRAVAGTAAGVASGKPTKYFVFIAVDFLGWIYLHLSVFIDRVFGVYVSAINDE